MFPWGREQLLLALLGREPCFFRSLARKAGNPGDCCPGPWAVPRAPCFARGAGPAGAAPPPACRHSVKSLRAAWKGVRRLRVRAASRAVPAGGRHGVRPELLSAAGAQPADWAPTRLSAMRLPQRPQGACWCAPPPAAAWAPPASCPRPRPHRPPTPPPPNLWSPCISCVGPISPIASSISHSQLSLHGLRMLRGRAVTQACCARPGPSWPPGKGSPRHPGRLALRRFTAHQGSQRRGAASSAALLGDLPSFDSMGLFTPEEQKVTVGSPAGRDAGWVHAAGGAICRVVKRGPGRLPPLPPPAARPAALPAALPQRLSRRSVAARSKQEQIVLSMQRGLVSPLACSPPRPAPPRPARQALVLSTFAGLSTTIGAVFAVRCPSSSSLFFLLCTFPGGRLGALWMGRGEASRGAASRAVVCNRFISG